MSFWVAFDTNELAVEAQFYIPDTPAGGHVEEMPHQMVHTQLDPNADTVSRWNGTGIVEDARSTYPALLAADRAEYRKRVADHRDERLGSRVTFEFPAGSGQLFYASQKTLAQLAALDSAMNPNALSLLANRNLTIDAGTNAGGKQLVADYDTHATESLKVFAIAYQTAFDTEYANAETYLNAVSAQTTRSGMAVAIQPYLDS